MTVIMWWYLREGLICIEIDISKTYLLLGVSWGYVCPIGFICIIVFELQTWKELK